MLPKFSVFWFVFVVGMLLLVPFPYHILPDCGHYLSGFTCAVLGFLYKKNEISLASDAEGMYLLAVTWAIFCVFCAFVFGFFIKISKFFIKIKLYLTAFSAYYLAMQMLNYGFDKVFKHQFYAPEPNTLYTPIGLLDKDILYWTAIGSSYSYNVFTGGLEVLAGGLLLFRRTRLLGAILAFALLAHIFAVNIAFNITVKCLSAFLCLLAFSFLQPYLSVLWRFFIEKENVQLAHENTIFFGKTADIFIKYSLIALIFIETLYPFLLSGCWNDDLAARPPYHGAYQIERFWCSDSISKNRYKRFFFHRQPYFILQNEKDEMLDYECTFDTLNQKLTLLDTKKRTIGSFYIKNTKNYAEISMQGWLLQDSIVMQACKIR